MTKQPTRKKRKPHPVDHPDDSGAGAGNGKLRKWRSWHEREMPIKIVSKPTRQGFTITVSSDQLSGTFAFRYPNGVWVRYPHTNKIQLIDNIAYIFTAHLPFLLKGNIRLEYSTGYPHAFIWVNQSFMRHLPSYWYFYNKRRGTRVVPLLKTLLNTRTVFSQTIDEPIEFPETIDEHVILPFTFGKDSFLSYWLAKEIGLKPILIWFNDPPDEGYEGKHKKQLFTRFEHAVKDKLYVLDNPLGSLREKGEGWFGWETPITSWLLLSLPFAYKFRAGYLILSNEKSTNAFFYDDTGLRVMTDYEQSGQATEEISLLTQSLTEGEVYTTTFLQGVHEIAILAILKHRYFQYSFEYLMSCWSEIEAGKNKRWCGNCSKCARIYIYLCANGVDPVAEAGFSDNMLNSSKRHLFNVFGNTATGTGWDAFGVNVDEQALAFYLAYKRGIQAPLITEFVESGLFERTKKRFFDLMKEYYHLHPENITPPQWKTKIDTILRSELTAIRKELFRLHTPHRL